MTMDFLYRGVSSELHESGKGLQPKCTGRFSCGARYGEATYGTGWTYGDSEANAVIKHQLDQAAFPTSGISTTPVFCRAEYYAVGGGQHRIGYVYRIDRKALPSHGVREFVVAEFTNTPSVPEDREVILVLPRGGLPGEVVVEVIKVTSPTA